jgi:hypothetical protein
MYVFTYYFQPYWQWRIRCLCFVLQYCLFKNCLFECCLFVYLGVNIWKINSPESFPFNQRFDRFDPVRPNIVLFLCRISLPYIYLYVYILIYVRAREKFFIQTPQSRIDELLFQEPTTKISAPNSKYNCSFAQ